MAQAGDEGLRRQLTDAGEDAGEGVAEGEEAGDRGEAWEGLGAVGAGVGAVGGGEPGGGWYRAGY